jgi:hypothetical protein
MKRIKLVYGSSVDGMQKEIDKWIDEIKPDIISVDLAMDDNSNRYIAILYDDNAGLKI